MAKTAKTECWIYISPSKTEIYECWIKHQIRDKTITLAYNYLNDVLIIQVIVIYCDVL